MVRSVLWILVSVTPGVLITAGHTTPLISRYCFLQLTTQLIGLLQSTSAMVLILIRTGRHRYFLYPLLELHIRGWLGLIFRPIYPLRLEQPVPTSVHGLIL